MDRIGAPRIVRRALVVVCAIALALVLAPPRASAQCCGCPSFVAMPAQGTGFYSYSSAGERWGTQELVYGMIKAATQWSSVVHSGGTGRLGFGDLSLQYGGDIAGHVSHRCGIDIDVRPLGDYPYEGPLEWWDVPPYRSDFTGWFILVTAPDQVDWNVVFFNDPAWVGDGPIQSLSGHDNHFHGRIVRPPAMAGCCNSDNGC